CVANGLLRRASRLEHFDPARVTDPAVLALTKRIKVHCDDTRITETTLVITTRDGETLRAQTPGPSGFPPFPLTDEQRRERCEDNVGYGGKPRPRPQVAARGARVAAVEGMADVRDLIPLLVAGWAWGGPNRARACPGRDSLSGMPPPLPWAGAPRG